MAHRQTVTSHLQLAAATLAATLPWLPPCFMSTSGQSVSFAGPSHLHLPDFLVRELPGLSLSTWHPPLSDLISLHGYKSTSFADKGRRCPFHNHSLTGLLSACNPRAGKSCQTEHSSWDTWLCYLLYFLFHRQELRSRDWNTEIQTWKSETGSYQLVSQTYTISLPMLNFLHLWTQSYNLLITLIIMFQIPSLAF